MTGPGKAHSLIFLSAECRIAQDILPGVSMLCLMPGANGPAVAHTNLRMGKLGTSPPGNARDPFHRLLLRGEKVGVLGARRPLSSAEPPPLGVKAARKTARDLHDASL